MIFPSCSDENVFRCFQLMGIPSGRGYSRTVAPNRPRNSVIEIGQSPSLQRFTEQPLNGPHHSLVLRSDEGKGVPLPRCPTGSSDAVNVRFRSVGNIVVDYVGNPADVDPPGRDISGGENAVRTVAKTFHRFPAAILGKIPL